MSDRTSFDFDAGRSFVDELTRKLNAFETSAALGTLHADLEPYVPAGDFTIFNYLTEVEVDYDFVDGVILSIGGIPHLVFDHQARISIAIPTIDGQFSVGTLSDEEITWILENRPEILISASGVSTEMRVEAMHNFQLNQAGEFEVFNATSSINVEVDVWVIEVGGGVQAQVTVMGDGTTVLRFIVGASVGVEADIGAAEATAGVNGSSTWEFTFARDEADLALAMLAATGEALIDDANPLDVGDVFDDYGNNQSAHILTVGLEAGVEADIPVVDDSDLSASFVLGGQMAWDRFSGEHTRSLYVEGSVGDTSGRIEVSESFAQNGAATNVALSIEVGAPESLGLPFDSGNVEVAVDLSDPRAAAAYDAFRQDPLSTENIATLLTASTVTTTTTQTVIDEEDEFEIGVGAAEIEIEAEITAEVTVGQVVKPAHSNTFIPVTTASATGHTVAEDIRDHLDRRE